MRRMESCDKHHMSDSVLNLQLCDGAQSTDRANIKRLPFTVEHVRMPKSVGFDFKWAGQSGYLALHDIVLSDARIACDDKTPMRMLDLRRTLTFLPRGVRAHGWGETIRRANAFTLLYFDQDWLSDELEIAPQQRLLQPAIYFQSPALLQHMDKLARLARARPPVSRLMADSLALLAGAELEGHYVSVVGHLQDLLLQEHERPVDAADDPVDHAFLFRQDRKSVV